MYDNRSGESYTHTCPTDNFDAGAGDSQIIEDETPMEEPYLLCFDKQQIDSVVEVAEVPGKGRCLFSRREFDPGALIFAEAPLFAIVPTTNPDLWERLTKLNEEAPLALPPLWHKAALICMIDGTEETDYILSHKWVENRYQEVSPDVYRVLDAICTREGGQYVYGGVTLRPETYQLYLQVWPLNAFGRSADPDGLVIYDSGCNPSCCWHHTDEDNFVLRARKKLVSGDEITISYLGESDLLAPTFKRRTLLQNWHFFCMCERCTKPVDVCRGFLCKCCHYGSIFLNYDAYAARHTSTQCEMCGYRLNDAETKEYIELENAYLYRIEEIAKDDLVDMVQVHDHAKNVFKQHWALYQLQTLLYDYYKANGNLDQAKLHLVGRLHYVDRVSDPTAAGGLRPALLHSLHARGARGHPRLRGQSRPDRGHIREPGGRHRHPVSRADCRRNMIMSYYFNAAALLAILCGYRHSYYYTVVTKRCQIEEIAAALVKPAGGDSNADE